MKRKIFSILLTFVMVISLFGFALPAFADDGEDDAALFQGCSDIMVGKDATVDGSVLSTYSCDGPRGAGSTTVIYVVPGETFPPGTMTPIYETQWQPYTWADYLASLEEEPVLVGYIPQVEETYRFIELESWYDSLRFGGMNEYGLTIGETTIGGRSELKHNPNCLLRYGNNYLESSLMVLGLQRAKTAREAIEVMGALAEEFGFKEDGEHFSVNDGNEVWAFEIFGPNPDWTPGCGKPGAVWCAQRIPDGHVGVSANRSRIGEIDLDNPDYFMASPNVYSLAQDMGWWDGSEPFIWWEAYAPPSPWRLVNLREWEALNMVAPSLNLDPAVERHPFSVEPDNLLVVDDIMAIHRDYYEGTEFDITENPAFYIDGEKSPMACPWGPSDLFDLLDVKPERSIGVTRSVFTYVSQNKADLPDPIKGCMWFGFGLAATTCYVPVYSGATSLPEAWNHFAPTHLDRAQAFMAFALVDTLSYRQYQNAIEDIIAVRGPAEASFFATQPEIRTAITDIYSSQGRAAAEELVTNYTNSCMNNVFDGYWDLTDYLLFKYYYLSDVGTMDPLPEIAATTWPPPTSNVGLTVDIPGEWIIAISAEPTEIDFGTLFPGEASDPVAITVENIGERAVDVGALIDPSGTVFENLTLDDDAYGSWEIDLAIGASDVFDAVLEVPPTYTPQGEEEATLIFEATTP